MEEARTLAEEAGVTSEFPELVTTDITNQKNKCLYEKLKEIVEQQLEECNVSEWHQKPPMSSGDIKQIYEKYMKDEYFKKKFWNIDDTKDD